MDDLELGAKTIQALKEAVSDGFNVDDENELSKKVIKLRNKILDDQVKQEKQSGELPFPDTDVPESAKA